MDLNNSESNIDNQFEEAPVQDTPVAQASESDHPSTAEDEGSFSEHEESSSLEDLASEYNQSEEVNQVYIDRRSGVFFAAEARVDGNISGNVLQHLARGYSNFTDQISSEFVEYIKDVYVATQHDHKAMKILQSERILILQGPVHTGKWSSAIHLLASCSLDSLFEISPDTNLKDIAKIDFEEKSGYLIDDLSLKKSGELNLSLLRTLGRQLSRQRGYLIITLDVYHSIPVEIERDYLAKTQLPNEELRERILDSHISYHTREQSVQETSWELIKDGQLSEVFSQSIYPHDLAYLADVSVQVSEGKAKIDNVISEFEGNANSLAKEWFQKHTDIKERALMLTVAVLNGAKKEYITIAHQEFYNLILDNMEPEFDPEPFYDIWESVEDRLKVISAHLVNDFEITEFGRNPIKRVVLQSQALQAAVLDYVWNNFDQLGQLLLTWLQGLGHNPYLDIRLRAAAAAGELSKHDFGAVRKNVLIPWAQHSHNNVRRLVGFSLGIPIWNSSSAPNVLGLLNHWSTLKNNPSLSWTAAAAYGGLVGQRFPSTAINRLQHIARLYGERFSWVITGSMITLFEMGGAYYGRVLESLVDWTQDKKNKSYILGLNLFLQLASGSKVTADPEGDYWPTLLWLAQVDEIYLQKIVLLWRRVLNEKNTRKQALTVLNKWFVQNDDDARLEETLGTIVLTIIRNGSAKEKERLKYYLTLWSKGS